MISSTTRTYNVMQHTVTPPHPPNRIVLSSFAFQLLISISALSCPPCCCFLDWSTKWCLVLGMHTVCNGLWESTLPTHHQLCCEAAVHHGPESLHCFSKCRKRASVRCDQGRNTDNGVTCVLLVPVTLRMHDISDYQVEWSVPVCKGKDAR